MATDIATATISALDPADPAAIAGAFEVLRLAREHDIPDFPAPCRRRFEAELTVPWPGEEVWRWVARDGAEVVALLALSLPTLDNLENADIYVVVKPTHRRRGVGRELYRLAVAEAKARGRRRFMGFSPTTLPGGVARDPAPAAFATAMGMANALDDVRRRLDLSTVDEATLDGLLAAAWSKAAGYSLVRWTGRVPDEYVDDVALLDSRLVTDAPLGDLVWEAEKVDAARIRAGERVRELYGTRSFSTAARHDETGRVVAWSALGQEYCLRDHAWQGITIVDPAHRGHRLGTVVKVENLRYAQANLPDLRYIDTWNAAVNDYMISINEAMGFRPVDAWHNWQQES
jgi:GNAT superfamily N-acetyltransferase